MSARTPLTTWWGEKIAVTPREQTRVADGIGKRALVHVGQDRPIIISTGRRVERQRGGTDEGAARCLCLLAIALRAGQPGGEDQRHIRRSRIRGIGLS